MALGIVVLMPRRQRLGSRVCDLTVPVMVISIRSEVTMGHIISEILPCTISNTTLA